MYAAADPGFPRGERQPQGGLPAYSSAKFLENIMKMKKIGPKSTTVTC